MDDLPNLLERDYGLKPQGKAAPMSTQRSTQARISGIPSVYDDVFGGPPKFTAPSFASQNQEGYDDIFRTFSTPIKNSSVPVFDAPVYDDDIFEGLKGIRNAAVPYDDVFSGASASGDLSSAPFKDLLEPKNSNSQRSGGKPGSSGFEDLIPGFGNSEPANRTRSAGESRSKHRVATASPRKTAEDPFVVLEPDLSSNSSSTLLPDSLEQLNMPSQPTTTSTKERKASSNGTMGIDKINAFDGFSITRGAAPSPTNKSSIAKSPLKISHGGSPHTSMNTESVEGKSVKRTSVINNPMKDHSKAHAGVPRADIRKSSGKTDLSSKFSSPGRYRQPLHENSTYVSNMKRSSPSVKPEKGANHVNEKLVTVDEVKLLTKPTQHPPPSRPPPPLVIKQGPSSKKTSKMSDYQPHSGKTMESSSIQELERFVSGGRRVHVGDPLSHCTDGKVDGSFAASASTAAMKEAMDRAEAKIKQAKEARGNWEREVKEGNSQEREKQGRRDTRAAEEIQGKEEKERVVKATREREDKEKDAKAAREEEKEKVAKAASEACEQEEHEREGQERERKQREKEREKEREREREREREKDRLAVERATQEARQRAERAAVERATAEARERAAAEARERAAAEAKERAERAAVERAAAEARERAAAEARERAAAERAAVERAAAEVRERAAAEARERAAAEAKERAAAERTAAERAAAAVRERPASDRVGSERASADARLRAERAAVERANAEARERAAERAAVERAAAEARERAERAVAERAAAAAKERQRRNDNDLESFFGMGARTHSAPRQRTGTSDATADMQSQNRGFSGEGFQRSTAGTPQSYRRSNLSTNTADDWTSLFTAPSGEDFQEIPGETAERRRARLERHQRTLERAANALAQKNDRDLQAQREQAEKNRLAETVDADIKRWATGKESNLRALLSTLQYILWPESGWQPVSLTDVITAASVKKVYRKATLCVHPDKVQQKGATIQQKYIAEKVFDLLKEAWNKFNSEELF